MSREMDRIMSNVRERVRRQVMARPDLDNFLHRRVLLEHIDLGYLDTPHKHQLAHFIRRWHEVRELRSDDPLQRHEKRRLRTIYENAFRRSYRLYLEAGRTHHGLTRYYEQERVINAGIQESGPHRP